MTLSDRVSSKIDGLAKAVSPRWFASRRQDLARAKLADAAARFGYNAIKNTRLHTQRSGLGGPGDAHLTESALGMMREICRDQARNNPMVKGLLLSEADEVVGTQTHIEARTKSKAWNKQAEALWREEMLDQPCELTGRFNFQQLLYKLFLSYRRDGDIFVILTDIGLQVCEGQRCGTPYGSDLGKTLTVTNGAATERATGRVLGYYIGKPNTWGYIETEDWQHYQAEHVIHVFNPDRFSTTRGEPALTPAVENIDMLKRYQEAELVAAHVNACMSIFITREDGLGIPSAYTQGTSSTGETEDGTKMQKIEPGMIEHLGPGESINAVTPSRPPAAYAPFVRDQRIEIGRAICFPLMLVTLDFSGATYMNARIAYKAAQKHFAREQVHVVIPTVSRMYRWWLARKIAANQLLDRKDAFAHEVVCQKWPYVDPYREAQADKIELENKTTSRTQITARKGLDYRDLIEERQREREAETEAGETDDKQETDDAATQSK